MKKLTVFTPTFNRKHLLPRLYESLRNQTDKDFIWMVIDDGSTDETKDLIKTYIDQNILEIKYYRKENEGMHSAHNLAYENIKTEWNTCIDSDDMMPGGAVESILKEVKKLEDKEDYYAIVGLDADETGKIIGTDFPDHIIKEKFSALYLKHNIKGDKKLVYKTSVMKNLPAYPVFKGERLVPLDYKSLLADQFLFVKPINKVWCVVEYQEDGSTRNMLQQYRRNPRGFAFSRISRIEYGLTLKEKYKNAIHLVSSILFSGDVKLIFSLKYKMIILASIPPGILLNLYIRIKTTKPELL